MNWHCPECKRELGNLGTGKDSDELKWYCHNANCKYFQKKIWTQTELKNIDDREFQKKGLRYNQAIKWATIVGAIAMDVTAIAAIIGLSK